MPDFSSMQLWLKVILGTNKRIDHQNTGLVYKNFCSILQYTIKSKETRIKIIFEFEKGVGIAIKVKKQVASHLGDS